jgi:catechol 2,3-dioxygenase-like lactoylglutathione lyase family enzyme
MFSHIMIGARDLETMTAFYDAILAPLDLRRVVELDDIDEAGVIWRKGDRRWPQFALRPPINGLPATWGNGVQISFATPSRATVESVWAMAIEKGARDEGAPGLRLRYAEDFYAAYCRDPEGNKICFVHAKGLLPN